MIDDTRRSKWNSVLRKDYLHSGRETVLLLMGIGIFGSSIPVTEPEGERIMSTLVSLEWQTLYTQLQYVV